MMRLQRACEALVSDSFYEASAHARADHPSLRGSTQADVCVVGGGLAGLSAALELAQHGLRVVVLEAQRFGWGASGRNGGQALAGYACEMGPFEQQLGREAAQQAWAMSCEALELMRERIDRHSIACDWVPGAMTVAVTPKKLQALREWVDAMHRDYAAERLQWLDADATRALIDSRRYCGGVLDPSGGHVHPLNYTLGLARAAAAAGAVLHEHSEVLQVQPGRPGERACVRTAAGDVRCDWVLLAGNVNLGGVAPSLARRVMPVGTYIIATEPLGQARADALIRNRAAVSDNQFALDYYRLSADHRMLFGGRVSYSTRTPRDLAATMRAGMLRVFPQLSDVRVTHAWGGFVDITMNRAPDFGRLSRDVLYLQGFSGHGLALTGLAGKLAAEAIRGQAGRFDLFAQLKHRAFPGGDAMRTPALVLGMLWYRLREML